MKLARLAQAGAMAAGAANDSLAIAGIKAYPLREPVSRRAYVVIEVNTKKGLRGFGECGVATAEAIEAARARP